MGKVMTKSNGKYGDFTARYNTYLSVEENPTNWGYMHFISDMKAKYANHIGYNGDLLFFSIQDQNDFDKFILREGKNVVNKAKI